MQVKDARAAGRNAVVVVVGDVLVAPGSGTVVVVVGTLMAGGSVAGVREDDFAAMGGEVLGGVV